MINKPMNAYIYLFFIGWLPRFQRIGMIFIPLLMDRLDGVARSIRRNSPWLYTGYAPGLGARRVANVNRQWAARSPRGLRANCGADLNYRWLPRLRCNDRSSGSSDDPPPELFAQEAVIRLPQEASSDPDPGSINAEIVIYRAVSAYCS
ncbi:hypothetical protein T03_7683 [Trichinella britovi]|uniref:Uncharacterized protein n=1 Tax=Trichinella britovi TaxID=45882 RepID=A0A0V1CBM4_TRIBR|nr:hypothetical protein T03_7683 [Trichinella britovi]